MVKRQLEFCDADHYGFRGSVFRIYHVFYLLIRAGLLQVLFVFDINDGVDYNGIIFTKGSTFVSALTVRNLDPDVKARLRVSAAQQGIAMEESVRRILTKAANEAVPPAAVSNDLGQRIQARYAGLGEILIAPRSPMRASPFEQSDTV